MSRQEGQHPLPRTSAAAGVGEIVEVQGGHIVRSIGRKDRHSKVCTSKGPRDRRVRLSAHTAIQFYDVQDRLGYDRPSKAVDWLIRNAKAAIDELDELPPWHPTTGTTAAASIPTTTDVCGSGFPGKNAPPGIVSQPPVVTYSGYIDGDLLPPSLESDVIADTIKYLFPVSAATAASNCPIDMTSRSSSQVQDLHLSLQSFQDPILFRSYQPPTPTQGLHFGSDQNPRMAQWNLGVGSREINFGISAQQQHQYAVAPQMPHVVVQNTADNQRGSLQSNAPESLNPWPDEAAGLQHVELSGFGSGAGYWGFRIPMRIRGEEDPGKLPPPSSASPSSRQ